MCRPATAFPIRAPARRGSPRIRGEGASPAIRRRAAPALRAGGPAGPRGGRSAPGTSPAVAQLASLAADVRALLGPEPNLAYAADWTEYGAHVLDGGAEGRLSLNSLVAPPALHA